VSRRHFEWAAREIALSTPPGSVERKSAMAFALGLFTHFSARFDRARFLARIAEYDCEERE